jgi:hypothetical protein
VATLIVLVSIVAVSGILLGGFVALCRGIRHTDRWGTLRPAAPVPQRHHMLAYAARWDDNTPALS